MLKWLYNCQKRFIRFLVFTWKNLDLFPSFSVVKTNGLSDHVFTGRANPVLHACAGWLGNLSRYYYVGILQTQNSPVTFW